MRSPRPLVSLAVLAFVVSTAAGCSSKSTAPQTTGTACADKVAAATAALENTLYQEINSSGSRPSDLDFRAASQLYQDALACDGTNADANLGGALVGLLDLTSDPEVYAAFDEWKTYLESHTPFAVPTARSRPLGVPLAFAGGSSSLRLPFELAPWSVLALAPMRMSADDPQISRVQAIFETRVLPRLTLALTRLGVVAARPGYTFTVTPRMQGDEDADPVEIDHSDILALRAACGLLASACHVAVAYDLNVASYDSVGVMLALTPGGSWMKLKPQGASHMGSAGTALSGAVDDLDAAISSIRAETDPQDDDLIKIGPDPRSIADAESIQVHLKDVRATMAAGYTRVDDWDGNPGTPDLPLTIRLGQFFANPVQDWKAEFPAYSVSVMRRPVNVSYPYEADSVTVEVDAPDTLTSGYYYAQYNAWTSNRSISYENYAGESFLHTPMKQLVLDRVAALQANPSWTGDFSGTTYFYGYMTAGHQSIGVSYYASYSLYTSFLYAPVITWNATTFDQWVWPDPTLHGVLPQMASSSQLLSTFGITAARWSQQVELPRSNSGAPLASLRPHR
jgi:hypothetical protein